jgi:hypothetical protein
MSMKVALERLLGGPCYHMAEVFPRPEHVAFWQAAGEGKPVDWDEVFDGFVATVDWPSCSFWQEQAAAYPDALIVLTTRSSPEAWWRSANDTIFAGMPEFEPAEEGAEPSFEGMWDAITRSRFTERWREKGPAIEAYERHNAEVRRLAPPERLLDFQVADGWEPLCAALGVPVPDEPFPHVNTTEEFRARRAGDPPAD